MPTASEARNIVMIKEKLDRQKALKEAEDRKIAHNKEVERIKATLPDALARVEAAIETVASKGKIELEYRLGDDLSGDILHEAVAKDLTAKGFKVNYRTWFSPKVVGRRAYDEQDYPSFWAHELTINW